MLGDSGLLRREPDLFRSGRAAYRIAEPLVTFYQGLDVLTVGLDRLYG